MPRKSRPSTSPTLLELAHTDPSGAMHRTLALWQDQSTSKLSLAKWIEDYRAMVSRPWIADQLGYVPIPVRAWIRRGRRILAQWPSRDNVVTMERRS